MPLFNGNVTKHRLNGPQAFTVLYKDKQLKLLKKHWKAAMDEMNSLIAAPQASI